MLSRSMRVSAMAEPLSPGRRKKRGPSRAHHPFTTTSGFRRATRRARPAEPAEMGDEGGMARADGARGALAVHAHAPQPAVDRVLLELGDVVADVVNEPEAQRGGPEAEGSREGPLGEAAHHLPVRPGE